MPLDAVSPRTSVAFAADDREPEKRKADLGGRWNDKCIDHCDSVSVIAQKLLPVLRWWFTATRHVFREH